MSATMRMAFNGSGFWLKWFEGLVDGGPWESKYSYG